jgi:hypothetical protein
MTQQPLQLIRWVELMPEGPVRWGDPIPSTAPGVYVVSLPELQQAAPIDDVALRKWIARVPTMRLDGTVPTVARLRARLASFWLPTERIVYIGLAGTSLAKRVGQYYRTPLGDRAPHAGGHWIKTLSVLADAQIHWAKADDPHAAEAELLATFGRRVDPTTTTRLPGGPILPFANLQTGAGVRKAHGISGSKLGLTSRSAPTHMPPTAQSALRSRSSNVRDLASINVAIQRLACSRPDRSVTAVEAAAELDRLGILRDSATRPGKPLRDLLRGGHIDDAHQEGGRFWFIECGAREEKS